MAQIAPRVLATLADADRLALFAALVVQGEGGPGDETDDRQRQRLGAAGLDARRTSVDEVVDVLRAALAELHERKVRSHHVIPRAVAPEGLPFTAGRLTELPREPRQLEQLLDWVVTAYLEEPSYSEARLNAELGRFCEDPATLRRALVDHGRLTRDPHQGLYAKRP
ncbi:DUF2087 domain-containing protein [Actinotalea sp. C106]|uniref:DUF2087 domain-containing protein n=1 Tax=Actinotalea sp. C106 TaxID=2908644 RepID=UPI0020283CE7|nr:DUF2087 domain-containing protein [Actinotalea sp. C106]